MRLVRVGSPEQEQPALIDDNGTLRTLRPLVDDLTGPRLSDSSLAALLSADIEHLPALSGSQRLGPCIVPGDCIQYEANSRSRASELQLPRPHQPIRVEAAATEFLGTDDKIRAAGLTLGDIGVELGVVIGDTVRDASPSEALKNVAGYCIATTVARRSLITSPRGHSVFSTNTAIHLGPHLVTWDEAGSLRDTEFRLGVNGTLAQHLAIDDFIADVGLLLALASIDTTLRPGDLICTGRPACMLDTSTLLAPGDRITVGAGVLGAATMRIASDALFDEP